MFTDADLNQLTAHLGKPEYIHANAIKEFMGDGSYTTKQVMAGTGLTFSPVAHYLRCNSRSRIKVKNLVYWSL